MQRRLVIVAIVFVVGFGLGYGATWLLVGPPGAVKPEATAANATDASAAVVPAPAAPPAVDSADVAVAPSAADVAQPAPEVAALTPDVAVPTVSADADPSPGQPESPVAGETPSSSGCVGKTCRLDFGGVSGGISVRRGRLDDGQEVDWERDFGPADKLGLIPAGPKVRVEVKAIGRTNGEPSAAWVVFRNRGTSLNGVISLKVGEKKLQLIEP